MVEELGRIWRKKNSHGSERAIGWESSLTLGRIGKFKGKHRSFSNRSRPARASLLAERFATVRPVAAHRALQLSLIGVNTRWKKMRGKNRLGTVDPLPVLLRPADHWSSPSGSFPRIGPQDSLVNCRDILKTLRESCASNDAPFHDAPLRHENAQFFIFLEPIFTFSPRRLRQFSFIRFCVLITSLSITFVNSIPSKFRR